MRPLIIKHFRIRLNLRHNTIRAIHHKTYENSHINWILTVHMRSWYREPWCCWWTLRLWLGWCRPGGPGTPAASWLDQASLWQAACTPVTTKTTNTIRHQLDVITMGADSKGVRRLSPHFTAKGFTQNIVIFCPHFTQKRFLTVQDWHDLLVV